MASLESAIAYIVDKYPHKEELSNARLTKMLYLADWYAAIKRQPPVTKINWFYDNYGPFVWDVKQAVDGSEALASRTTINMYGQPKELIYLCDTEFVPQISLSDKEALDHVIKQTKDLTWAPFIRLVYSTYPVASSSKYSYLNLNELAEAYARTDG